MRVFCFPRSSRTCAPMHRMRRRMRASACHTMRILMVFKMVWQGTETRTIPNHCKNGCPMIRMSAIPRDVKAHIARYGRWKATQCDFDAKYRWCGNVGTQVTIRRIAEDDHPQSLRDSSPGPASGDGLRPRASRIALAYKQFPLFVGKCNPRGGGATCRFCSWAWRNRWGNRARKGPRRPLRGSRRAWRPSRHCRCTA